MKKSISLSIFVVALLGIIISVHSMSTTNSLENSLLLANIEALTDPTEGGGGGGGNWLKGYRMQPIRVEIGYSASGSILLINGKTINVGVVVKFDYKTINCCKKDAPGTDCNKDGNEFSCDYATLD